MLHLCNFGIWININLLLKFLSGSVLSTKLFFLQSMTFGSTGIPMGTNCAFYLANFYLFSYEFDFLKCKNNTCLAVLHRLYLVCRIVADFPDFENFMYID